MTPRLIRAAFGMRKQSPLVASTQVPLSEEERSRSSPAETQPQEEDQDTAYPCPEDGARALQRISTELTSRMPGHAAAMMPHLSAVLRSCYLLIPGFPIDDMPLCLRGFPVNPPRTLAALEDLLNRIEDILLLELATERAASDREGAERGPAR